ncbi:UNVERIFIED_CONTAM: hypothetical protein Cloal_2900 [Acetivibrio alkalicellulosi]
MKTSKDFCHCLNKLLTARGWTAARLALELKTDSSYVRKWLRGERIPSLRSQYINEIALSLVKGQDIKNIGQIKTAISDILKDNSVEFDPYRSITEYIREILAESQLYSLKNSPPQKRLNNVKTKKNVLELLEYLQKEPPQDQQLESKLTDIFNGFSNTSVIYGKDNVICAAIGLIKEASKSNCNVEKNIFITFQSDKDSFNSSSWFDYYWNKYIKDALEKGWNIYHLCCLNKNSERSLLIIKRILHFIEFAKNYRPLYFNKYGILRPPMEIIAVKNIGTLICFATENVDKIDSALFYRGKDAANILDKYMKQLLVTTQPLIKVLSLEDYFELTTKKDKKTGGHLWIWRDLISLSIPSSLWEKHLSKTVKNNTERSIHCKRIKSRQQSFYEDVANYPYMYICYKSTIENLVKTGQYYYKSKYIVQEKEYITEHLNYIIWLLETFENFEIALLDNEHADVTNNISWEVKGEHTVMIEALFGEELPKDAILVSITETTIASAFQDYFLSIWDSLSPKSKDKNNVISWFKEQLDIFRKIHCIND